jgi:hypothetical protein
MAKQRKTKVKLTCPYCHETWAEMSYGPDGQVNAEDIKILKGDKTFKDSDVLACSMCGYGYNTWDLFIAIGIGDRMGGEPND